jgi:hypothetical protein
MQAVSDRTYRPHTHRLRALNDVSSTAALGAWYLGALVLVTTGGPFPGAATVPWPAQAPPPNPIAAEPDGRRVLSRVGVADHEAMPRR